MRITGPAPRPRGNTGPSIDCSPARARKKGSPPRTSTNGCSNRLETVTEFDVGLTIEPMYWIAVTTSPALSEVPAPRPRITSPGPAPPYPTIEPLRITTTIALSVVPRTITKRDPSQIGASTIGARSRPVGLTGSEGSLTLPHSCCVAVIEGEFERAGEVGK